MTTASASVAPAAVATFLVARPALLLALGANPFILVRALAPRSTLARSVALAGLASALLNTGVAVALHVGGCAFSAVTLAIVHWAIFTAGLLALRIRRIPLAPEENAQTRPWLIVAVFAVLAFPFTPLTGIDTYKWQDLASAARVDACIPWLVHPASLLGFTPRSYPSAQPLMLATIQILGGLGVDAGFYVMSLATGITGIFSAWCLGKKLFRQARPAHLFSAFYVFSPVFMRYNHWATGRGLFLALLPLFLLGIAGIPRAGSWILLLLTAPALALSHKTGLVALALIPASLILLPLTNPRRSRVTLAILLGLSLAAVLAASPNLLLPEPLGRAVGALRAAITRFAWMLPCTLVGAVAPFRRGTPSLQRRLLPGLYVSLPLAHAWDMYGALIALPFVVMTATGAVVLMRAYDRRVGRWAVRLALALALAASLTIVAHRSLQAAPPRLRAAARFLDAHDRGPYRVFAPGSARDRIQGYVAGCPRFTVSRTGPVRLVVHPPPPLTPHLPTLMRTWIGYLRHVITVSGIQAELYGDAQRFYYVTIDGRGTYPRTARLIYNRDGIQIYRQDLQ